MIKFRAAHIEHGIVYLCGKLLHLPIRGYQRLGETYGAFIGAGDAVRSGALIVISLIADLIVASCGIVPEIKSRGFRGIKPQGTLRPVAVQTFKGQTGRVFLPKIPDRHGDGTVFGAKGPAARRAVSVQRVYKAQVLTRQLLFYSKMADAVLIQIIFAPYGNGFQHLIYRCPLLLI